VSENQSCTILTRFYENNGLTLQKSGFIRNGWNCFFVPQTKKGRLPMPHKPLEQGKIKRGRKPNSYIINNPFPVQSRDIAAGQQGVSNSEIQRYIRLTFLLPELLEMVDQKRTPVMAGYEVSFLDADAVGMRGL
jgi:hypothetical protein